MTENNKKPIRRVRPNQRQLEEKLKSKKVKKWAKAWGKWLLIWMWIFIFLIIFLVFGFFFYLTSNPNSAKSLGIWAWTVKSITYVFAGLIFGILFVIFLILGLKYLYNLATKDTNKTKNLIWTIVIFILWMINITLWYLVFARIANIKVEQTIASNDIIVAYANYKNDKLEDITVPLYNNNAPLIWPIKISFQLNQKIYFSKEKPNIVRKEGKISEKKFIVDCWNGQKIEYFDYKFPVVNYCLYTKKWKYKIKTKLIYNTTTAKNKEYDFDSKEITIDTNVWINWKIVWKYPQLLVWERWSEIKYDLNPIPNDLSLEDYNLSVDFEWKWNFQTYKWLVRYVYHKAWAYDVLIKLPSKNKYYYYFPVKIEPSTKPICNVKVINKNGRYTFDIIWEKTVNPIKANGYYYKLVRFGDGTEETIKSRRWNKLKINLANGYKYQLFATVVDTKWKKWKCSSNIVDLTDRINYTYDVLINWKKIDEKWKEIVVKKIPWKYNLEIKNLKPKSDELTIGFDTDNDMEIDEEWKTYFLKITDKKTKIINLIVKDSYGNKSITTLTFKVDLKPIIADLKTDKYKWDAPLTVRFDASTSKLNNKDDEITYFDWDFGDGVTMKWTRQWVVTHTYKKPSKSSGYIAKVTVITEKWYKDTATKKIIVYKPVNTAKIYFPNNLSRQASVWSPVKIELNTSGIVKDIHWDFGDGNKFSCSGRSCKSISHPFEKKWKYTVKVEVTYDDNSPSVTATETIYVTDNSEDY